MRSPLVRQQKKDHKGLRFRSYHCICSSKCYYNTNTTTLIYIYGGGKITCMCMSFHLIDMLVTIVF